jgi:hypothetical protein
MSDGEIAEVKRRRESLEKELDEERINAKREALKLERYISILFWLQMIAGGTASLLGLTRFEWVTPWMVSVIAAVATACAVVVRQAKMREKANWHWACRDNAHALLSRLRYEMPEPITLDNVAAISKEYRQQRTALGLRRAAIHTRTSELPNENHGSERPT